MSQHVTASFGTWQEAEAARARLAAAGIDPNRIAVAAPEDQAQASKPGLFDALTDLLAPGTAARPGGFVLTATVLPQQLEAATLALNPGQAAAPPATVLRESVVELIETAEELVIEKEAVVVEEVVLRRQTLEHVEQIDDSVRRTEVEVEWFSSDGGDQSGRKR